MHPGDVKFFFGVAILVLAPALPNLLEYRNPIRYLGATVSCFFLISLPLLVFLVDAVAWMPTWKGGCRCGWLNGFHQSKFAVLPLVLLAMLAMYRVEVLRSPAKAGSQWEAAALWCGAITSALITGFLSICFFGSAAIAAYLPVWYGYRAWQFRKDFPQLNQLFAIPFWTTAGLWAHSIYSKLPDTEPPDCFVVTAASRGHRAFVGPFALVEHNGRIREANTQLIALWQFEARWRQRSPRSHAAFRLLYNRIGPLIAKRIRSPWVADLLYLALKPIQWLLASALPR